MLIILILFRDIFSNYICTGLGGGGGGTLIPGSPLASTAGWEPLKQSRALLEKSKFYFFEFMVYTFFIFFQNNS